MHCEGEYDPAMTSTSKHFVVPAGGLLRVLRLPLVNTGGLSALLLLLAIVGQQHENTYLSESNLRSVSDFELGPLIVALGASVALLGGIVDLSIGASLGLGATSFAYVFSNSGSLLLAVGAGLLAGLAVGTFNGTLSIGFGVNPLVATLSTFIAVPGLTLLLDNTSPIAAFVPQWQDSGGRYLGPVSVAFILALGAYVVATIVMGRTRPGRHIRATGGSVTSADRAGIRTKRIRFALFLLTALCGSVAGMVEVCQLGTAPALLGSGLVLQVFAGILLGGFSISRGGRGSLIGAVLGITLLDMLGSLLDLSNVSSSWQQVVTGGILLVAVYLDTLRRRERFQ
jgi:ribose/xylose/arabinose/galactoside ABC-type transport system permease subunit